MHVRKEMLTIDDEDGDVLMINEMMDLELIGDGDSMPKAQTSDLGSQMAVARDRGSKRRTHSPIHAPEDAGDEKRQRISPSLTRFRSGSDVKTLDLADYVHFGNPKAGSESRSKNHSREAFINNSKLNLPLFTTANFFVGRVQLIGNMRFWKKRK